METKIQKRFGPLQITIDEISPPAEVEFEKIFTFTNGKTQFKARVTNEDNRLFSEFFEIDGKPFSETTLKEPLLLVAENFLQTESVQYPNIQYNDDPLPFPIFETVKHLPRIDAQGKILVALDYFDGPIGGLIDIENEIYLFNWCMEAIEENFHKGPRIFFLRKAPQEMNTHLRDWCRRYLELESELSLVANPHIYPVSKWQQSQLRSSKELQTLLNEHDQKMPALRHQPIMGWMEGLDEQFDAIRLIHMTKEDSEFYQRWQNEVGAALKAEDQALLNRLFEKRPASVAKNTIFKVTLADDRVALRDYAGQPLPEKFWLTTEYSINDLTHLPATN